MIGLIALNLVRNRGRTALTAAGIAIGVATIVALTQGLKQSVGGLSNLGGANFGVFQSGVADPTASVLPESMVERVRQQPGVLEASAISLVTDALPASPSAIVFGVEPGSFVANRLVISAGRRPRGEEAIVGDGLAGARLGVTTIAVTLKPDASEEAVSAALRRTFPGTTTISNPGEAARANPGFEIVTKAVLVIAVLALVLGAIAVTNTMAMAVLERQRELALLSAIGWSPGQVGAIVLGEGAGVGLIGAAVGVAAGVALGQLIVSLLGAGDLVSPVLTPWGLGRGLLIGLAIGVLGGIYPAWRVGLRPPAELLDRF